MPSETYENVQIEAKTVDPLLERFHRIVEKKMPPPPPPPPEKKGSEKVKEDAAEDMLSSSPAFGSIQTMSEKNSLFRQKQRAEESTRDRAQPQLQHQEDIEVSRRTESSNDVDLSGHKDSSTHSNLDMQHQRKEPKLTQHQLPQSFTEDKKRPPAPPQGQPHQENETAIRPPVPPAEGLMHRQMQGKQDSYYEEKDWKSNNVIVSQNADYRAQSRDINRKILTNSAEQRRSVHQEQPRPQPQLRQSLVSQARSHQQAPLPMQHQSINQPPFQPNHRHYNPQNRIDPQSQFQQQTRQNIQQQPSIRSTQSTIFKNVWNRVEQGLDSLANVEDMVAGRANRLTNQVTGRARVLLSGKTNILRIRKTARPNSFVKNSKDEPSRKPPLNQKSTAPLKDEAITTIHKIDSKPKMEPSKIIDGNYERQLSSTALPYGLTSIDDGSGDSGANIIAAKDGPRNGRGVVSSKNTHIRAGGSADHSNRASENYPHGQQAPQPKQQLNDDTTGRKNSPFVLLQQSYQQQSNTIVGSPDKAKTPTPMSSSIEPYHVPGSSWPDRLASMIPSLPRMPSLFSKMLGRGSGSHRRLSEATLDQWKQEEEQIKRNRLLNGRKRIADKSGVGQGQVESSSTPHLADILSRSNNGKTTSLLANQDMKRCDAIGRNQAILDVAFSGLIATGAHQLVLSLHRLDLQYDTFKGILNVVAPLFSELQEGWLLYTLSAAFLMAWTNYVLFGMKIHDLARSVSSVVEDSSKYAQLYVRLVSGQSLNRHTPEHARQAAAAQVVELVQAKRLQWFVTFVLASMIMMTISVVRPILSAILNSIITAITLPELKIRPISWSEVGQANKGNFISLMESIKNLLAEELSIFRQNPIVLAFQLSIFAALVAVAFLPMVERYRKIIHTDSTDDEEVNSASASAFDTASTVSNLGISSASRLSILSKSGSLESTLEKWHATLPQHHTLANINSIRSTLRKTSYIALSILFLIAPVFVYFKCMRGVMLPKREVHAGLHFDFTSLYDVSILLLFALKLSWQSIFAAVESSGLRMHVRTFMEVVKDAVEEASNSRRGIQTKLGSSISPTLGISVEDLWASHTYRKAWAVRGVSLTCNNGEVVAILGENGSGKSRLLTAIAEALVKPSKLSLTTTKVRGRISVGGLDTSKWDGEQLKKRLGVFLNDVRTIADNAEFMSGFTLDEILEPTNGASNGNGASRAINIALKITGLSETLMPRLPTKLATVVTANEEEMKPSRLKPKCHALSLSEWTKLLLTRVIAQTIFDNENSLNTPLSGSLLLLDDVTNYFSEVEELKIIQALKKSGAATIFTSNKWASGRLADRVIVIQDGAIVESGNHNELLARGQQSLYGAKWLAMTG